MVEGLEVLAKMEIKACSQLCYYILDKEAVF